MHNAATWLELAALARTAADRVPDPAERWAMLDVVASYESQARDAAFAAEATRFFCGCPSRFR